LRVICCYESGVTILNNIKAAIARGDLVNGFDMACQPQSDPAIQHELDYLQVLLLARLGDWRSAMDLYAHNRLDLRSDVDSLSLRGRILKDAAFDGASDDFEARCSQASDAYRRAFDLTGDLYPAINAATLALLAGQAENARTLAQHVVSAPSAGDDYWGCVTRAEAALLLGNHKDAERLVSRACTHAGADPGSRSTTLRQFRRIATAQGDILPANIETALLPPTVMHYCGHMFRSVANEAMLATAIDEQLYAHSIGIAYGALACGADILIAERLLDSGGELHVVIPFDEEDFVRRSVTIGGGEWQARYQACRDAARQVHFASRSRFVGDDAQFGQGSALAMGLCGIRARQLGDGPVVQLALWDGTETDGPAGTSADIRIWRAAGGQSVVVPLAGADRTHDYVPIEPARLGNRGMQAMLFADFPGFSRLPESVLPLFWREVMACAAWTLQPYSQGIRHRNTWGDALYIVFDRLDEAALALLDLRDAMREIDCARLGLETGITMRIGAHFGPVYRDIDPVTTIENFFGSEVSFAARIEPVTPPGSVYVTEPFAAHLEMLRNVPAAATYVGQVELPKGYGRFPLYRLDRR
jgi:adenylate cyclase